MSLLTVESDVLYQISQRNMAPSVQLCEPLRQAFCGQNRLVPYFSVAQVFPEKGTVSFSAGLHGWAFTLTVFADLYAKKFGVEVRPR